MFWIFANDIDAAFAPDNAALDTTLANGGRNFHDFYLLTCDCPHDSQTIDYTGTLSIRLYLGCQLWLQDSQDEGISFGDGNAVFKMRRQ
jgi:hypothetical protein